MRKKQKAISQTKQDKNKEELLNMNKVFKARKSGFTLVELLIVTVIIGILAGMMMLMMGSATDGAEATKLINDLRLVKSASLLYYADNDKWPEKESINGSLSAGSTLHDTVVKSLERYMDKPLADNYGGKVFYGVSDDGRIYFGLSADELSTGARAKLIKNKAIRNETGDPYDNGVAYIVIK
ncbi:MAG: prepilin-type N-terminal cleavage/methylation domain-containing protein [Synergistaceae bacterium]|jgi:prepilin-type N-terminal cleavage/methylation domain-containing protein|nr:prepilin-type N-terminal cleavage/methylation domain-containing protein [Synergistaceae bacterium]